MGRPDFRGILPLLDSHICDNLEEPSWYVMPTAKPIRQALGADPDQTWWSAQLAESSSCAYPAKSPALTWLARLEVGGCARHAYRASCRPL
jgi:hypothetical protein